MYEFPQTTLKAFCEAPDTFLDYNWEDGYHKLLAHMGANHPEWFDDVRVVPVDALYASGNQYREYIKNMIAKGVKFHIDNCRSYWMIKIQPVADTDKQVITLEYVSQYSDVFTGHGIEYFPVDASFTVMGALRHRVKHDMTVHTSPFGYKDVELALAMFPSVEIGHG